MDGAQLKILTLQGMSFSYPKRHIFAGWSHDFRAGLHILTMPWRGAVNNVVYKIGMSGRKMGNGEIFNETISTICSILQSTTIQFQGKRVWRRKDGECSSKQACLR
jgi:hypothetical protein